MTEDAIPAGPACVLIGAPGAGKTKVGRTLAAQLGVDFRDTDQDVAATAGKSVSDIFVADGEPAFRAMEAHAVAAALREHAGVLALGGGAVLDPGTQALLADQRVVWLRVGLAVAARRTGMSTTPRPLLLGNLRATLKGLLEARDPIYAKLAVFTVDADQDNLEGKAGAIRDWLAGLGVDPRSQEQNQEGQGQQ